MKQPLKDNGLLSPFSKGMSLQQEVKEDNKILMANSWMERPGAWWREGLGLPGTSVTFVTEFHLVSWWLVEPT